MRAKSGAVLGELGSRDLARIPSQGRRQRRLSGWTGTGAVLGSLCEPRAAPSAPCAWWVHEFRDQLALRAKTGAFGAIVLVPHRYRYGVIKNDRHIP